MTKKIKATLIALIVAGLLVFAAIYLLHTNIPILEPRGLIAQKEKHLIIIALLMSLIVVIPVYSLTVIFAWRYRETNTKAKYSPDLDHSRSAETIWWLVPSILIGILSVIAWNSSHQLDPYRLISSKTKPITIQVVALDWKWLFIYPSQNIASVNMLEIPAQVPITFEITSDAPMNSFWIPQLGGQIYAMPGMATQLHLIANGSGNYEGSSANISGVGFSGMTFNVRSVEIKDFNSWAQNIKSTAGQLDQSTYSQLAEPSQNNSPSFYSSPTIGLFLSIMNKYMLAPDQLPANSNSLQGVYWQ